MANYSKMTHADFDHILADIVDEMSAEQILAIGDVYTILSEELNNEVLDRWESENPEPECVICSHAGIVTLATTTLNGKSVCQECHDAA